MQYNTENISQTAKQNHLTDSTSLNLIHLSSSSEWVLVHDQIVWGAERGESQPVALEPVAWQSGGQIWPGGRKYNSIKTRSDPFNTEGT